MKASIVLRTHIFRLVALMLLAFGLQAGFAQTLRLKAPRQVAQGDEFRVEYTVNSDDADDFHAPINSAVFDVLYGPATSRMSSYQIINGRRSSSSSVTYTYVLSAKKTGSFTLPQATVRIGGHTIKSNSVQVRVVAGKVSQSSQSQASSSQGNGFTASNKINGRNLFIKVTANKRRLYEQEALILTYKVYTRVNLIQLQGNMPDLKGFLTQEVPLPQQKSWQIERVGGTSYKTTVWSQYVMFPQQTGHLTIPSIKFSGIVQIDDPTMDPFDAFFNGNSGMGQVKRDITTPSLTIDVEPLPKPQPNNFSGAVGSFSINSKVVGNKIRTNENLTLRVTISGQGNMKLITPPHLQLPPSDFSIYPPETKSNTRLTADGLKGTMEYDYVVIPKRKGTFTLPSLQLSYFNSATKNYNTCSSAPIKLQVEQGRNLSDDEAELMRARDIKPIHNFMGNFKPLGQHVHWPVTGVLSVYALLTLAAIMLYIGLGKYLKMRGDTESWQRKRARNVAKRYLRAAKRCMESDKKTNFYTEIANALRVYASHRLSIPMSQFSIDRVCADLGQHEVPEQVVGHFRSVVENCQMAQYANTDADSDMNKLYQEASAVILDIEEALK